MKFPNHLLSIFKGYFPYKSRLGLPTNIDPQETITRYLNSDSYYRKSDFTVKPKTFEVPSDMNPPTLSAYRIVNLDEDEIWKIGKEVNKRAVNRNLHGRADIVVSVVQKQNLDVLPDNKPYRHTNIIGWPPEKERRKSIALVLAAASKLSLLSK